MRVKILTGNSFIGTTAYVLGATKEQRPEVLFCEGIELSRDDSVAISRGLLTRKEIRNVAKYIGYSFALQTACHPLNKPVRHYIITFPPSDSERLRDNEELKKIVQAYMYEAGIIDTQYLAVRHNNTVHPHVHLIFNPINDNAEVISESRQFKNNESICKKITKDWGLNFSKPRNFKKSALNKLPKHDRSKVIMRMEVEKALDKTGNIYEMRDYLNSLHIIMTIHQKNNGEIYGLSYHYDDPKGRLSCHFKASQLSRSLSCEKIKKYFEMKRKTRVQETYQSFLEAEKERTKCMKKSKV